MLPDKRSSSDYARSMAAICRTGDYEQIPGVSKAHAMVYRDLIHNVVAETLSKAYPIAKATLSDKKALEGSGNAWNELVALFLAEYPLASPQLWRMPRQLYDYVAEADYARKLNCPYLDDLLLFEWVEIEVHMMPDVDSLPLSSQGDLRENIAVLNPEHQLIELEYPVYRHKGDELLDMQDRYFLLCFRHPESLGVHFLELSPLFAVCFETLKEKPHSGAGLAKAVLESLKAAGASDLDHDGLSFAVLEFLNTLLDEGMIRGFLKED